MPSQHIYLDRNVPRHTASSHAMTGPNQTPGEHSLAALLATLKTTLHPDTFVFLTFPDGQLPPMSLFTQMSFREKEGLTIITTLQSATAHGLDGIFPSRMITLDVHSSLEAVGFMAAVSGKLAESGFGVNPCERLLPRSLFRTAGQRGRGD